MGLAWLIGDRNRNISYRIVIGGLLLQFALALFILKTQVGVSIFAAIGNFAAALLGFVAAGSGFVFGEQYAHHFFAFHVLPTIIVISSLMAILYHLGVLQRVVASFAWVMQRTLQTSGSETLAAAANVFIGQTEAPLVIRPYVAAMTRSELMALMTGGFATIAGTVFAAYVSFGIDAGHLVAASVISAPASLLIAKLMIPETEQSATQSRLSAPLERSHRNVLLRPFLQVWHFLASVPVERNHSNVMDAMASGALDGLRLALNIAALLIAILALVAMVDALLGLLGSWIGGWFGYSWEWSLAAIFGYVFAPFAWLMGIPWHECLRAGELLGTKMVLNEFIAYATLGEWSQPDSGVALSERTQAILTYALCGFANFGSIGIQIGGIGGIAPERRSDLARLGIKAMLGGTFAMMMTACVAGLLLW